MDAARIATDKELARMERELHRIYSRASKEVGETWKKYVMDTENVLKPFREAYDEAKKSGDKAAIKAAGRNLSAAKKERTLYSSHYKRLTESLSKDLSAVNEKAVAFVNGKLPKIYAQNYNGFAGELSKEVSGISFELVDASTIKNLATSDKTLLPYKKVNGRKDVRWNTSRVNSEVLQGILQGEPMDKIAGRLSNVLNMNEKSAIRNARTSVTSAENKGRMDMIAYAKEKGVIIEKKWIAANDSRTREAHADLDGETIPEDEPFENFIGKIMYPGDPDADPANTYNCRCSLGYKVVGFAK